MVTRDGVETLRVLILSKIQGWPEDTRSTARRLTRTADDDMQFKTNAAGAIISRDIGCAGQVLLRAGQRG